MASDLRSLDRRNSDKNHPTQAGGPGIATAAQELSPGQLLDPPSWTLMIDLVRSRDMRIGG
jgi:hypothetical protein